MMRQRPDSEPTGIELARDTVAMVKILLPLPTLPILAETTFVGIGANDIPMLAFAGLLTAGSIYSFVTGVQTLRRHR